MRLAVCDYADPLDDNDLEVEGQTVKHWGGRFLGKPAAPCGKTTIMCACAGPV
jgi:hypothetical protein